MCRSLSLGPTVVALLRVYDTVASIGPLYDLPAAAIAPPSPLHSTRRPWAHILVPARPEWRVLHTCLRRGAPMG